MTRFLILSDVHYKSVNRAEDIKKILYKQLKDSEFDVALLAGDIAITDEEIKEFLITYFNRKKVCFLGGNHMIYIPFNRMTVSELVEHHKDNYPIDSDWSFMENDYKIIDDCVIIGCNLYTDYKYHNYKLYNNMVDDQGRRLSQKGDLLPLDPRETQDFYDKVKDIWNSNSSYKETNDKLNDLYHSVAPDNNETIESFRNRVSEEIYNNYISWLNSLNKQGKKEYTVSEYIDHNMRLAQRNMNDFRYGKVMTSLGMQNVIPDDYEVWHKRSLKYIDKIYKRFENTNYNIIVMTHHCPSPKCIPPIYYNSDLNASFVSNLDKWIIKHPKIKLWCCGHIHSNTDTMIGNTRLVCNPIGYIHYNEHLGFKPYIIDSNFLLE